MRYPGAIWRPISRNYGGRRSSTRGVILHVAVSESSSLRGWFNDPRSGASSHLYVRRDGTLEQYVDMRYTAWTSGSGSATTIGVETQGMGSGKWTPQQVEALAQIVAWAHREFGVPLRVMTSSKASERGVGYHALGVPATSTQKTRGISKTGGQLWSKAVGKTCPGPERIRQIPDIIARAQALVGGKGASNQAAPAAPIEEDDLPYSKDELIQAAAEGVVRALGGKIAPDALRTIVTEGAWNAQVGSGEGRRTLATALVNAEAAAKAARAESAALRSVLAQTAGGGSVDYDRIDQIVREAVASGIDVTVTVPSKES